MKKPKHKNKLFDKAQPKQVRMSKDPIRKGIISNLAGWAAIILLGSIIYSNSFKNSFQFDDINSIIGNSAIRNVHDIKSIWNFSHVRFVPYYSFALNYHVGQLNVWGYHLVNLLIHIFNALLVYWLTILIFSLPAGKGLIVPRDIKIIALLTALLFVSHPLATQSVTYIVQRMASLVAMFYLLTLAFYIKGRIMGRRNIFSYFLFAGSFIAAVLAMLTKENAFTLPLAIVLIELFFLQTRKPAINFKDVRVILLMLAFLGVIFIIPLNFSFSIFNTIPPIQGNTFSITPLNYLYTQFSVILKYIQLLFLPVHQRLDYDFPISNHFFEARTLVSFLVLASLVMLAFFLFNRNRFISFGIAWFFLTLSIESGIIPISDLIYEHRTYLPSFGFFMILSSGIYALLWERHKYLAISIYLLLIGSYAVLTFERNKIWKDHLTLWDDAVSKAPDKVRPLYNRGNAYRDLERWDNAIADYSKVIEMAPNPLEAYTNRGILYGKLGKWDKAISDYSKVISIDPEYGTSYYNRGIAYAKMKQWNEAIADYSRTIEFDPKNAIACYNRGVAYSNLGQRQLAIADYTKAIDINPEYAEAYSNRGNDWGQLGQWEKAISDYSRTIEIDPKNAMAYNNRGSAYGNLGQWDKAIADFSKALEIDPEYEMARSRLEIAQRYVEK